MAKQRQKKQGERTRYLRSVIAECDESLAKLKTTLNSLEKDLNTGKISPADYKILLKKYLQNKPAKEWVNYYTAKKRDARYLLKRQPVPKQKIYKHSPKQQVSVKKHVLSKFSYNDFSNLVSQVPRTVFVLLLLAVVSVGFIAVHPVLQKASVPSAEIQMVVPSENLPVGAAEKAEQIAAEGGRPVQESATPPPAQAVQVSSGGSAGGTPEQPEIGVPSKVTGFGEFPLLPTDSCTDWTGQNIVTVNTDTTLCVNTYNMNPGGGTAITIGSSNVVLDCNGATIRGPSQEANTGLAIGTKSNVTIKNCNIEKYMNCVTNYNSNNTQFYNNRLAACGTVALSATTVNNSFYYNNTINTSATAAASNVFSLYAGRNVSIYNNTIYNNTYTALYITSSENLSIYDNIFYNNSRGIDSAVAEGSFYSNNTTIYNNLFYNITVTAINISRAINATVFNNTLHGIGIPANGGWGIAIENTNNSTIYNNTIYNVTTDGIKLAFYSSNNSVHTNNITKADTGYAINILMPAIGSKCQNNTIYNNYLSSTLPAYDNNAQAGAAINNWTIEQKTMTSIIGGSKVAGNFYSDYTDFDMDSSGFGDTPYTIAGGAGATDYLPLALDCYNLNNYAAGLELNNSIKICSGTYNINDPLSGVIIVNANSITLNCNGAILKGSGAGIGINVTDKVGTNVSNCTTQGYAYGLVGQGISQSKFFNNVFYNATTAGVQFRLGSNNNSIYNNTMYFGSTREAAILTEGLCLWSTNGNRVYNNTIYNQTSLGIDLMANNTTVFDNNIFNITSTGIFISGSNNTIHGNIVRNNTGASGITVAPSGTTPNANLTIFNNTLYSNKIGIYVYDGANATIRQNYIFNSSSYGVQLSHTTNNTLYNNSIYENYDYGIYLANGSNITIYSNWVNNNTGGIYLTTFSNNSTIFNNNFTNNSGITARIYQGSSNLLYNNYFAGSGASAEDDFNSGSSNFWNTSKSTATNIIGGASKGGNYYGNAYTGADLDGDGIGESAYPIDGATDAQDYLPLTDRSCTTPTTDSADYEITGNTILCAGTYSFYDLDHDGAISINASDVSLNCNGSTISVSLATSGDIGIMVDGKKNVNITNCNVSDFDYGILLEKTNNSGVSRNNISVSASASAKKHVLLGNSSNLSISGNRLTALAATSHDSIYSVNGNGILIFNNTILNTVSSSGIGVYFEGTNNSSIYNNSISQNSYGIETVASRNNTISNNTILGNTYSGIWLTQSTIFPAVPVIGNSGNTTIDRNYITGGSTAGIAVWYEGNDTISNNIVQYNGVYNLMLSTTLNTTVYNNTLENTTSTSSTRYALYLSQTNNSTIYNNTINNQTNYGIYLESGSSNNTIRSNNITSTTEWGSLYLVSGAGFNTIYNNYFDGSAPTDNGFNNSWNISRTAGQTVINGAILAGNYYNSYFGWDGDNDKIGEISQAIAGTAGSTDYAPLTARACLNFNVLGSSPLILNVSVVLCRDNYSNAIPASRGFIEVNNDNVSLDCNLSALMSQNGMNYGVYVGSGKKNVNISDCKLNNFSTGMLASGGCSLMNIHGNEIYNASSSAVSMGSSTNSSVYNNTLYDSNSPIVALGAITDGTSANGLLIYNNTIRNISSGGINLGGTNHTISNNRIYNNSKYGIFTARNAIISGNELYNNTGIAGIEASNASTVRNNIVYNSTYGINITGENNTLSNNTVTYSSSYGIWAHNALNNTLLNNTVSNGSATGIYLNNASNSTIYFNNVYNNAGDGIWLDLNTNNSTIYTNNATNATGGIASKQMNVEGADNLLYNNYLSNARDAGMRNRWNTSLTVATNIIGGSRIGGNYYPDYPGGDLDSNGIGENPYIIPSGGAYSRDSLPLTDRACANITLNPLEYYLVESSVILCPGQTYNKPDRNYVGAIRINGSNLYVNCNGSTLDGWNSTSGSSAGYGIKMAVDQSSYDNINITNCNIKRYDDGIYGTGLFNLTISGNTLTNNSNASIYLSFGVNNTIANNTLSGSGYGIVTNLQSEKIRVYNNSVSNNTNYGMDLANLANGTVSDNDIFNNTDYAVRLNNTHNTFQNNRVYNNTEGGVYVKQGDNLDFNLTIYNNSIYNNTDEAIRIEVHDVNISNNLIQNNTNFGIALVNAFNITIFNNTILNSSLSAIKLGWSNNSTIFNNTLSMSGGDGILLDSQSSNNTIHTNNMSKNLYYGLEIELNSGCEKNLIYNNYFSGNLYTVRDRATGKTNYWNTSTTAGKNIINGSFLGGNYYDDYNWFDSNNDSAGDLSYPITGGISNDYLPLTNDKCLNFTKHTSGTRIETNVSLKVCTATFNVNDSTGLHGAIKANANNIAIDCQGAVLYGNNAGMGIFVNGTSNITIENCTLRNYTDGIYINGSTNGTLVNATTYSCTDGIDINWYSGNWTAKNTISYSNANAGIRIRSYASNSTFDNISVYNNSGHGITLGFPQSANNVYAQNISFSNISAYNNTGSGINAENASNISFFRIWAYNNTEHGISLNQTRNATFDRTELYNNTVNGLYMASSYNSTLANITATYNTKDGILLSGSVWNNIFNNSVRQNSQSGINITASSSNNTVHTNNITGSSKSGLSLYSSEANYLYNNWIGSNTENGAVLLRSNTAVMFNNTLAGNTQDGLSLDNSNNTTIYNNTIRSSGQHGINVLNSASSNILHTNNITSSTQYGLKVSLGAASNLIYNNYLDNTRNAEDSGSSSKWNTTLTVAVNIIGGTRIGGNYFSTYPGGDLDNNGIGENAYLIPSGISGAIDYLPLTRSGCFNVSRDNATSFYLTGATTLCGGTYQYNDTDSNGLFIINSSSVTFDCNSSAVLVGNQIGFAINITDRQGAAVQNCRILNYTIAVDMLRANNSYVRSNNLSLSTQNAILSVGTNNTSIYGNIINSTTQSAVKTSGGQELRIFNNTVHSNSGTALELGGAGNSTIYDNTIRNNTGYAVQTNSTNNTVQHNRIYNNTNSGLLCEPAANGYVNITIYNNTIFNNTGEAVVISGHNAYVYNNYLENSTNSGILAGNSTSHTFYNNTIYNSSASGIALQNVNSSVIYNNTVTSGQYGIVLRNSSSSNTVNTNNISSSTVYGLYLLSGSSNLFYNNYLSSSSNAYDSGTGNKWNTTLTAAGNIIGGAKIGGNYFSNYEDVDCNGDGIGEEPYRGVLGSAGSIDYAPLTNTPGLNFTDEHFTNNYLLNTSKIVCKGSYYLNDSGNTGAVTVNNSNIILYCRGARIIGNSTGYGIYALNRNNVTIDNCTFDNYSSGAVLTLTNNTTISGSEFLRNSYGISITASVNDTVMNTVARNSTSAGIYTLFVNNSTFTNLTVHNNTAGLDFYRSVSNTLSMINCTNSTYCIRLDNGSGNYILNNNISMSNISVVINVSNNNTISGNRITGSFTHGIAIYNSGSNLIYDNILSTLSGANNSNAWDNGTNSWNTSRQLRTNIIGGAYTGGNSYDDYTTLDSDGDGIGDAFYPGIEGGLNIDYLPITNSQPEVLQQGSSESASWAGMYAIYKGKVVSLAEFLALRAKELAALMAKGGAAGKAVNSVSIWMAEGGTIEITVEITAEGEGETAESVVKHYGVTLAKLDPAYVTLGINKLSEERIISSENQSAMSKTVTASAEEPEQADAISMLTGLITASAAQNPDYWELVIDKGERKNVDLDKNGQDDVAISYDEMKRDMAKMTFEQILHPTEEGEAQPGIEVKPLTEAYTESEISKMLQEPVPTPEEKKPLFDPKKLKIVISLLVLGFVTMVQVMIFVNRHKRKRRLEAGAQGRGGAGAGESGDEGAGGPEGPAEAPSSPPPEQPPSSPPLSDIPDLPPEAPPS